MCDEYVLGASDSEKSETELAEDENSSDEEV